ncbi:MAG: amidase [Alphaproteobacteria bacterium]|nr:amidase [Alphaproteobacteria bacterium]
MATAAELGCLVPGGEIRVEGAAEGPLKGVTFVAKDIFDVAGTITSCGNPTWASTHGGPARKHAWAVQKLLDAGAPLVGKSVTDQLAFSIFGENFHHGTPRNAAAPDRQPGGSSSGSASAVAGKFSAVGLGTDTGGSVRIPASYNGIIGLRPTHGILPTDGVMDLAASFDTVGWFARSANLFARVGDVLLPEQERIPPRRFLIAEDLFEAADPAVRDAVLPKAEELAARLGGKKYARVATEALGGLDGLGAAFRTLQLTEIWKTHGDWIEREKPEFGPKVAPNFAAAKQVFETEDPAPARALRERVKDRVAALLDPGDMLVFPTAPFPAPKLGQSFEELAEVRPRVMRLTCLSGLSGIPQLSLPAGVVDGAPIGLSIATLWHGDRFLVRTFCGG